MTFCHRIGQGSRKLINLLLKLLELLIDSSVFLRCRIEGGDEALSSPELFLGRR